ncbi:immunity 26/phosphotriesterase HocA family protein [Agromyces humatus]|uniref:Uncharacterized protein n=1 Tax=Agromyces humatus TaxID=279573 RepID=A0ABN2KWE6_9MICO|nr:immunity 26/phosphotriesterase HocA family protein [Agromyces humatus]
MKPRRPELGSVVQFTLPNGRYAYGRVLRDAAVAFYRTTTDEPGLPPIGNRDYQFVVGVDNHALRSDLVPAVGFDPGIDEADEWPPAQATWDPITGAPRLYARGEIRPATVEEATGLEPAAVWSLEHLIPRLMESEE